MFSSNCVPNFFSLQHFKKLIGFLNLIKLDIIQLERQINLCIDLNEKAILFQEKKKLQLFNGF